MALRVTKYKPRGPSLIRGLNDQGKMVTIDREDEWGVEFITNVPHPQADPYTVFLWKEHLCLCKPVEGSKANELSSPLPTIPESAGTTPSDPFEGSLVVATSEHNRSK